MEKVKLNNLRQTYGNNYYINNIFFNTIGRRIEYFYKNGELLSGNINYMISNINSKEGETLYYLSKSR